MPLLPATHSFHVVGGRHLGINQHIHVTAPCCQIIARLLVSPHGLCPRLQAIGDSLFGSLASVQVWYLFQDKNSTIATSSYLTLIRELNAGQQSPERTLAGTVAPDDAHAFAGAHG